MHDAASSDGNHPGVVARHATLADLGTVVPAYGAATWDEAVASWMLPDEKRRRLLAETETFSRYVRELLEAGVLVVAETDGIAGVSVWLHADGSRADEAAESADEQTALLREIYGEHVDRVQQIGALTAQRHPLGQPYYYLQQMAVLPPYRGRGLVQRRVSPAGVAYAALSGLPS